MQKVVGSSPIIRSERPAAPGGFSCKGGRRDGATLPGSQVRVRLGEGEMGFRFHKSCKVAPGVNERRDVGRRTP
ncbi:MAG: hypothetical protein QOH73_1210 [Gaiellaceae bacterium]|nr:hypothetical protein [Gaiellaceae bacterium]